MEWYQETIIRLLISAMERRGCTVIVGTHLIGDGISFDYEGKFVFVHKDDIENALHYAYRIEWEPKAIVLRFERYLIDLHNKRQAHEDMGITIED